MSSRQGMLGVQILNTSECDLTWRDGLYRDAQSLSRVQLFATPWTAAHQAPPSLGFSRQAYWSGLPFPLATFLQRQSSQNEVSGMDPNSI